MAPGPSDPAAPSLTVHQARRVLGVNPGASREEILRAWKRLSLVIHPDKNENSDTSKESFIYLTNAKELLIRLAAKETPTPTYAPRPQPPAPQRTETGTGVSVFWQCAACLVDNSAADKKKHQRQGCCAQAGAEDVCFCGHELQHHRVSYSLGGPRLICEQPGCLCRDFLFHPPECVCNCGHGRTGHAPAPPFGCLTAGCRCASFHAPRFTCGCGHLWSLHQTVVTNKARPQSARTKSAAQQHRWAQQRSAYMKRKNSSGRWASSSTFSTFSTSGHSSSTWSTSRPPSAGSTRPKSAQPTRPKSATPRQSPNSAPGADWRTAATSRSRPSSARPATPSRPSSARPADRHDRPSTAGSSRPSSARAQRPPADPPQQPYKFSEAFSGPQSQPPPPKPRRPQSAGLGGRPPPAPGGPGTQSYETDTRPRVPARPNSAFVRVPSGSSEQSGNRPAPASVQRPASASVQRPSSASAQRQSSRPASACGRPSCSCPSGEDAHSFSRQEAPDNQSVFADYDQEDLCQPCEAEGPQCEGCGVELKPSEGYRCSQCPNSFLCDDCVGLKELVHDDVYHAFVRCSTTESDSTASIQNPSSLQNPTPHLNPAGGSGSYAMPTPPSAPRPSSGSGRPPRGARQPGGNAGMQRNSSASPAGLARAPSASVLEEAARTMPHKECSSSIDDEDRPAEKGCAPSPNKVQADFAPRQPQPYRGTPRVFAQLDSVSADLERLKHTQHGPQRVSPPRPSSASQLGRGRRVSG